MITIDSFESKTLYVILLYRFDMISLGSSPSFLVALFVICAACLAGTALMTFKKSSETPAGYALLASRDQK